MSKLITALFLLGMASHACLASEGENQAKAFVSMYASLCLKNLSNLKALREALKPLPKLPPEKAALFLAGHPGDAWPVPDPHGTFVLALPKDKHLCTVHARRANTVAAKKLFAEMVKSAPAPLVAKQLKSEQAQTPSHGQIQTLSYAWSVPQSARKMLFTLTTTPSDTAPIQVLGSAAIVSP